MLRSQLEGTHKWGHPSRMRQRPAFRCSVRRSVRPDARITWLDAGTAIASQTDQVLALLDRSQSGPGEQTAHAALPASPHPEDA